MDKNIIQKPIYSVTRSPRFINHGSDPCCIVLNLKSMIVTAVVDCTAKMYYKINTFVLSTRQSSNVNDVYYMYFFFFLIARCFCE